MAKFDFECQECKLIYEAWTGCIADPDAKRCPSCSSEKIVKQISGFAFHPAITFEDYTPGEQRMALQQKAIIESKADQVRSGEIAITIPRTTPSELRPVI